jgi:cytochrome oxidase assembly protein ShyY1
MNPLMPRRPQRWRRWLCAALVVAACLLMTGAGFWQLQRGYAKQAMLDRQAQQQRAVAIAVTEVGPAGPVRPVFATGGYAMLPPLLLDGQSHQRRPGTAVWNVFEVADGSRVLVNRGWQADIGGCAATPEPAPTVSEVRGLWRALPVPGMRLNSQKSLCDLPPGSLPSSAYYPTVQELRCLYGPKLRDGLLDLNPDAPGALIAMTQAAAAIAVPPARHYGYAAQWWIFALTLGVLSYRLSRSPASFLP